MFILCFICIYRKNVIQWIEFGWLWNGAMDPAVRKGWKQLKNVSPSRKNYLGWNWIREGRWNEQCWIWEQTIGLEMIRNLTVYELRTQHLTSMNIYFINHPRDII